MTALMPGEASRSGRAAVASPFSRLATGHNVMRAAAVATGIQLATLHPVDGVRVLLLVLTVACVPLGWWLRRIEAS